MTEPPVTPSPPLPRTRRLSRTRRIAVSVAGVLAVYGVAAYLLAPWAWQEYARRHPSFDDDPRLTETGDGHPGGPLNVGLIGSRSEIEASMTVAKWYPADALGLKSDIEIAEATVLKRPFEEAPVSSLYLFGRKEDLAFEQPVGDDPRRRHHVRLWQTGDKDADGRAMWIGAASYDERVGLSYTTGQITHHIAPDVDSERDHVITSLKEADRLSEVFTVPGFHKVLEATNGGGDPWHTDGALWVGVIAVK